MKSNATRTLRLILRSRLDDQIDDGVRTLLSTGVELLKVLSSVSQRCRPQLDEVVDMEGRHFLP